MNTTWATDLGLRLKLTFFRWLMKMSESIVPRTMSKAITFSKECETMQEKLFLSWLVGTHAFFPFGAHP